MLPSMPPIVARVDAALAADLDALVADGTVASRSDGVRLALEQFIDRHRRAEIGQQIVAGYAAMPQADEEDTWSGAAAIAMIAEEPW
jgi:metal-responsive CopG/Arc/MetJ family transcriptional regulator